MTARIELVDRVRQPHPEQRLDLPGAAGDQEPVKTAQRLHISASSRRQQAVRGHRSDHSIDIVGGGLPHRFAQRRQHPLELTCLVLDGHRTEASDHPRGHERLDAFELKGQRIGRRVGDLDRPALHHTKCVTHTTQVKATLLVKVVPTRTESHLDNSGLPKPG